MLLDLLVKMLAEVDMISMSMFTLVLVLIFAVKKLYGHIEFSILISHNIGFD